MNLDKQIAALQADLLIASAELAAIESNPI